MKVLTRLALPPRGVLAAAVAVLLLAPGLAAAQEGHSGDGMSEATHQMMASVDELRGLSGRAFEIGYVERIIPHHVGALEMAEAVVDRAPHAEVREAAGRIIDDQRREIEALTTFLREEYRVEAGRDERQAMPEGMMREIEDAEPEMAEKLFLLMMREHHQSAIEMGELALDRARSEELLEQAREMVGSQRAEQEQFAGWLEAWYGIEAPAPTGDMGAAMELAMGIHMPETGGGALSRSRGAGASAAVGGAVLALLLGSAYALRRRRA